MFLCRSMQNMGLWFSGEFVQKSYWQLATFLSLSPSLTHSLKHTPAEVKEDKSKKQTTEVFKYRTSFYRCSRITQEKKKTIHLRKDMLTWADITNSCVHEKNEHKTGALGGRTNKRIPFCFYSSHVTKLHHKSDKSYRPSIAAMRTTLAS